MVYFTLLRKRANETVSTRVFFGVMLVSGIEFGLFSNKAICSILVQVLYKSTISTFNGERTYKTLKRFEKRQSNNV